MTRPTPITKETPWIWARFAWAFVAFGLFYPLVPIVELFNFPDGAAVRPMGMALAGLISIFTPLIVVPFGVLAIRHRGASRILGIVAILVSAIPLPLYMTLSRWIVDSHGLIIEP